MNFLNKNKEYLLTILLFVIIIISWTKMGLIAFNDWEIPFTIINFDTYLNRNFSSWMFDNLGYQTPFTHFKLPYISFIFILLKLKISVVFIELILLCTPFILIFYGFNRLFLYLFPEKERNLGYVAGLVYSLSLPFLFTYGMFGPLYMTSYAALPLIFYYSLHAFNSEDSNKKILYSVKFIVSFFIFVTNSNIALLISIYFYIFLYNFFVLFSDFSIKKSKNYFKILFFINLILFLLYTPFLIENYTYLRYSHDNSITITAETFPESWYQNNTLWEVFRLGAFFNWYQMIGSDKFIPYTFEFKDYQHIFSSFFIVLFAVSALLLYKKRKNSHILYPLAIFLLGIIFVNGLNSPFREINQLLFTEFPYFSMFRQAYTKIGIINAFAISILFLFSFIEIYENKNKVFKKIFLTIIIFVIVFNAWPMIKNSPMKTTYSSPTWNLPSEIQDGINTLNNEQDDSTVLFVPTSNYPLYDFGYLGTNFYPYFLNKRVIFSGSVAPKANDIINGIYDNLSTGQLNIDQLGENNIGYIYYQKTIQTDWLPFRESSNIEDSVLKESKLFKVILDNKDITIYKLDTKYVRPILNIDGNIKDPRITLERYNIIFNNFFPFQIANINTTINLNFLQTFHSNWSLILLKKRNNDNIKIIPTLSELLNLKNVSFKNESAGRFSNIWIINPEYIKQNFSKEYYTENQDGSINIQMLLYFKPQLYFLIGIIFSGILLLVCCYYLFCNITKKNENNYITSLSHKAKIVQRIFTRKRTII